ncbi:MAG: GNAT family N-acetyltransferase [Halobacteriota archaeon]
MDLVKPGSALTKLVISVAVLAICVVLPSIVLGNCFLLPVGLAHGLILSVCGHAKIAVEVLDNKKIWDQFVENSPQGTLFHTWDFLKIVEKHSGSQLVPYAIFSGNELMCVFPFFITRRQGLTLMRSPPPDAQIPYLGPAFDPSVAGLGAHKKEKIFEQVTGELCSEVDKIAPNFMNFRTVPNFLDVRSFIWKNFTAHLMFTSAINLEKSVDEIWASFSRGCRQKIKRVSAYSPEVQQTNDVSSLLAIWRERFRQCAKEEPLLSESYLKELVATFPQDVTVYNVSIDGRLATASTYCAIQKERYCSWIGGVSARRDLGVVEYLEWEIIRRAKSEGFKKLDLTGAPNQRISEFKFRFNPAVEPFCYVERTDMLAKIANFARSKLASSVLSVKRMLPRRGM